MVCDTTLRERYRQQHPVFKYNTHFFSMWLRNRGSGTAIHFSSPERGYWQVALSKARTYEVNRYKFDERIG